MTAYINSVHNPHNPAYGPEYYWTDASPIEHAGALIYERLKGVCWDIVIDGICITQRAGLRGAKEAAEMLSSATAPTVGAGDEENGR